jgi:hypothetical protein
MANFKTHLLAAAGVSGAAAFVCAKAGLAPFSQAPALLALGTLGGLLPDIDSDHSTPIKIGFTLLAFSLAFVVMFAFLGRFSELQLVGIWLGVFVGIRYLVLEIFASFTVHRGAFHSVLAAAFFGLCAVSLSWHIFETSRLSAWLQGLFVSLGYIVHLSLDELFSVDLLNRRLKRSFGTALKIVSLEYWGASLLLLLATAAAYSAAPPYSGLPEELLHKLEAYYSGRG